MMDGLIERLRKNGTDQYDPCGLCDEAADEIERLTDELINVEQVAKDRYCKMQSEIERLQRSVRVRDARLLTAREEIAKLQDAALKQDNPCDELIEAIAALEVSDE